LFFYLIHHTVRNFTQLDLFTNWWA